MIILSYGSIIPQQDQVVQRNQGETGSRSPLLSLGFKSRVSILVYVLRFVYATLMASKSLFVGIAQPLDESGSVSDPLVFINLIDSGVSWKGTYSELADRLGVGIAE